MCEVFEIWYICLNFSTRQFEPLAWHLLSMMLRVLLIALALLSSWYYKISSLTFLSYLKNFLQPHMRWCWILFALPCLKIALFPLYSQKIILPGREFTVNSSFCTQKLWAAPRWPPCIQMRSLSLTSVSPTGNASFLPGWFRNLSFVFSFQKFYYPVSWCEFL